MSQATEKTVQAILNAACDPVTGQLVVGTGVWNGTAWVASSTDYAVKVTEVGAVTYLGKAAPGSAEASAVWQAKKIDASSGTKITFADSNANFDNIATDLTTLTYG
jgi:hypothetical protein